MAEDDERGRQNGTVVKGHDQLISLKLPHLVGNGLDFKKSVAVMEKKFKLVSAHGCFRSGRCLEEHLHT